MLLYCPTCQASFPAADRCPQCSGRLATPAEAHASAPELRSGKLPDPPKATPVGRLIVGIVVGLGLYAGLRAWAAVGLLAAGEPWKSPTGLAVGGCLKVLAAAAAGLLAGAGRPRGASPGLAAGLAVGGLLVAADRPAGDKFGAADAAAAVGAALAAAAAGAVGAWRWPAPVELPPPPQVNGSSLAGLIATAALGPADRPLRWWRVLIGGLIAAGGIALSDPVRDALKRGSAGAVGFGGTSMVTVVDLQMAGLFVMLGGAVAGATTGVGTRHGVLGGVVGGLATVWMPAAGVKSVFPVMEGLLKVLGLPTTDLAGPGAAVHLFFACLAVAAFGGWLGGTLFPPVLPKEDKKRQLYS